MNIAIVGNPNCGKTTLFNELTGANQKVGNWPGVTVDKITGSFTFENQQVELVDLPGIYSLSAFSEDEKIAVQYLLQGEYDLIINVVDASSLERSLFLTMQLRELGQPILVVANMKDLAVKRKIEIDDQVLGKSLNMQLEYVSAFSAKDISRLKKNILDFKATVPNSGEPRDQLGFVESEAELLSEVIPEDKFNDKTTRVSKAWVTQKTLEVEPFIDELFESNQWVDQTLIEEAQARLKNTLGVPVDVYQAQEMYKNIERILKHSLKKPDEEVEEFDDFSVISNLKDACVALGSNIMALSETLADPLGLQIGDSSNAEEQAESTGVELGVFQSMRQHFGEDEAGEDAAFAYLLFVLLYIPCIVAVSAAWKEIGAILSLIQVYYSTMLAWVLSTIYFQATSGGSNFWILISIAILVTSVWAILFYAKRSEVFTQGKLHPSR